MKYTIKKEKKKKLDKQEELLKKKSRFKRLIAMGIVLFALLILLVVFEEQLSDEQILDYLKFMTVICFLVFWKASWKNEKKKQGMALLSLIVMPVVSFYIFETVSGNFNAIMENTAGIILLNVCIYYLLYMAVFAACNRARITVILLNTLLYLLAVANAFVVQFRHLPILPADVRSFWTAMSVAGEFQYEVAGDMVIMGLLTLLCNVWMTKVELRLSKRNVRVGYCAAAIFCIWGSLYGMLSGNLLKMAGQEGLDFFIINNTYQKEGFMACTMQSIRCMRIEKPKGYSVQKVRDAVEGPEPSAEQKTVQTPDNVIVIMNESFADLSVLGDVQTSEPMFPYIKSMAEDTMQGWVYTSQHGGGTANSEWEFLTGNTTAFLPKGVVAYQFYVEEGDASLVEQMKKNGYKTIAWHPYKKDNYRRPRIYDIYGFDEYYGIEDIKVSKLRSFASDESNYQGIIQMFQNKQPGEKLFVFNITMQNHGGYADEAYQNTVSLTDCPGEFPEVEQYLSLMQESDRAFYNLIQYFSGVGENTLILMFGDHQPGLESEFYARISEEESQLDVVQKKMITPYVMWANYELDVEMEEYLSLNYLGSDLLLAAGIDLPPYNRYLLNLQKKMPVINVNGFMDENRVMHAFDEPGEYQDLIHTYRMLQYNNLFDERSRAQDIFN